jgi:hypothetical protein
MRMIWDGGVPLGFTEKGKPVASRSPVTCVLGDPGSGKTTSIIANYLLDEPGKQSFIVLDSKLTVYPITHEYRRKVCGDENVKLINPKRIRGEKSDKWNPAKLDMNSPDYEEQAMNRASGLIPNLNEKQPHFAMAARSFGTGALIDENIEGTREKRAPSLMKIREMATADAATLAKSVERMMKKKLPAITTRVAKFRGDTEELDNIRSTYEVSGSWLTKTMCTDMDTMDGVDFRVCRDRPTTIYASLPPEEDKDIYFRMLAGSAAGDLFKKPGLKTTLIIEEGYTCGRLEILEKVLAIGRELDIEIVIVFQWISQIKELYPAAWQRFVSGALVAFRTGESETARFLSERAGFDMVPRLSMGEHTGQSSFGPSPTWSLQKVERIPAGKFFSTPRGIAVCWLPGDDKPRIVRMRQYNDIKQLNRRAGVNPLYRPPAATGGGKVALLATVAKVAGVAAVLACVALPLGLMAHREPQSPVVAVVPHPAVVAVTPPPVGAPPPPKLPRIVPLGRQCTPEGCKVTIRR